jgi:hypothetical protein
MADNRPYTQPDFSAVDTYVQIAPEIFLPLHRILQEIEFSVLCPNALKQLYELLWVVSF